jgi:glycosyltransferase involved in cell wall biosynthesis
VVKETPAKCRLDIWGDGPLKERLLESAEGFDNIRYHGSYVYPDALPQIYSETDVSFVVYDNTDINVRLALPNKLYESAYFGIPMIVATETQLWTQAKEKGIGFAVRPGDVDELRNTFAKLDKQVLRDMQKKALSRINSSQLVEDGNKLFLKLKNECRELTKKIDCQD